MKQTKIRLSTAGPIIIVVVLLIAFGFVGLISTQTGEDNLRTAIKETSRPITTTSAKLLFNPLYTLNISEISNILSQYVDGKTIIHAAVYDENNAKVTEVTGAWTPDLAFSASLAQKAISTNAQVDQEFGQYLIITTPIAVGGSVIGAVEFAFDQTAARSATGIATLNITLFTSAVLVITAALFFFLIRTATTPLSDLAKAAKQIGSGDLEGPVKVEGAIEIAEVATALESMRLELQTSYAVLEQRVQERTNDLSLRTIELENQTRELEKANALVLRRITQLQALAEVARSIADVETLERLLPEITRVVSDKFGYYHTGVFLSDTNNEYAILAAANSEGGLRMLNRGHRLKIGQVGIVGTAIGGGKVRIALDTGADASYFNNPDLPGTRSEMALPLRYGSKVIGALDVQSLEPNAFSNEDAEVLSTLADQVSIAIQNARQYEAAQKSLAEADALNRQYLRAEWARLAQRQETAGYTYSLLGTRQVSADFATAETQLALEKGEVQIVQEEGVSALAIPIKLREETIGVLNVRASGGRDWHANEINLAKAVADRVAISAENARLFEETTTRAERERTVANITNKIRSTNDPQAMIETALSELQKALNVSKVQIVPHQPKPGTPTENKGGE